MTWAHQDCDRQLRVGERQIEYGHLLKKMLQEEEGMRKKVEEQLEAQGAELEEAYVELMIAQTEMAQLKEAFSKYRGDALMEVSRL